MATPVFYKGEQVGGSIRHDEKLAMFLLRYRDPVRYGAWVDSCRAERQPDGAAITLSKTVDALAEDAYAVADGERAPMRKSPVARRLVSAQEQDDEEDRAADAREAAREASDQAERDAEWNAYVATLDAEGDSGADGSCGSSPSAPIEGPSCPASRRDVAGSEAPP